MLYHIETFLSPRPDVDSQLRSHTRNLIFMCELWIANCWSAGLKEGRGAWPLASRKSDSLQYGYDPVSISPQRQRDAERPLASEGKSEAEGGNGYHLLCPPFQGQSASESHSETKEERGSLTCAPITTTWPSYDPKAQLVLRFPDSYWLWRLRFSDFFRALLIILSLRCSCIYN